MPNYVIGGVLGAGKSLCATSKAVEYAAKGRRVVTNFFLDLGPACRRRDSLLAKAHVEIISAQPTSAELIALGRGGPSEREAGLLILDECGVILNSREWNDGDRMAVLSWLLHTRKLGWDVIFLVQHHSMIDKQIRIAVCQYNVYLQRLDALSVPIVSWFFKIPFPQVHVGVVRYGFSANSPVSDRWVFQGKNLYGCYDTQWMSDPEQGPYCTLSPMLSKFRYQPRRDYSFLRSLIWRIPLFLVASLFEWCGLLRRSHYMTPASSGNGRA